MLSMVPQPVKAVILLFPFKDDFKKKRDARYAEKLKTLGEGHIDPTVVWIKQTVRQGFILSVSPCLTRIPIRFVIAPLCCVDRLGMPAELWRCFTLWLM